MFQASCGVVYVFNCKCGAAYIGSTTRYLHDRAAEHMKTPTSAIFEHRMACSDQYLFHIIAHENNELRLRIAESMHIYRTAPTLNRRHDGDDVTAFTNNYNLAV